MKKYYINPKTNWTEINPEEMIAGAGSGDFNSDDLDGTSNGGKTSTQNITDADVKGEAGWASGW